MAGMRLTRIARDIVQVPVLGSSVFLLLDERVTIVDSGPPGSAPRILEALRRLGRDAADVEQILITHYHPDHLGGLAGLLRHVPARVGVHAAEAPAVCGDAPMPAPLRYPWLAERLAPAMRWLRPCPVDTVLRDGDELPVLGGLRVVHTPGHTPGHIALHLPDRGVLICGDALQRRPVGLLPPARLVTADWRQALRSVDKLAGLDFEVLAFSHFPPLRGDACTEVRRLARTMAPSSAPTSPTRSGERGALTWRGSRSPTAAGAPGRGDQFPHQFSVPPSPAPAGEGPGEGAGAFIDISMPLSPDTPVYPGDPRVVIERLSEASGDTFALSRLTLGSHAGTHVDPPAHGIPGGGSVDTLPLAACIGPAFVLDVTSDGAAIAPHELVALPAGTERLLLRTGGPLLGGRTLSPAAAAYLVERGVRLVGIDALSIEPADASGEVHRILLAAGVVILEGLDLAQAPPGTSMLICLPLKVADGDGAPARAVLWMSDGGVA